MVHAAERDQSSVRQRGHQAVARARRVLVAEHDQHRTGDRGHVGGGQRCLRPAQEGDQRGAVVARAVGEAAEHHAAHVLRVRLAGQGGHDGSRIGPVERARADAEQGQAAEPRGLRGGQAQQHVRSGGEADRVEHVVLVDSRRDAGLHLLVLGRVGGLGRGSVAEQVDRDRLPAGVGEQVEPAGPPPVVFGRGGESVYQQHRRHVSFHAQRVFLSSAVAFSMSVWCFSSTCSVPMTRSVLICSAPSRNSV